MTTAKLSWLAFLPVAVCSQSLPPLGEPLLNANGQNSHRTGVASVRYGPTCSGIFVAVSSSPGAPAYVLANGHCITLLGTNEVVLDRAGQGEVTFFAFIDVPTAQRIRVPIRRVAYATQKGLDLSILELDSTASALIARGVQPARLAAAPPRVGDALEVVGIPATGVSEAERVIRLSRCTAGETVQLLEGRWHTYDTARNDCLGIRGGSSGSPVFETSGEVAGLIFTTTWGESPLAACATNRPCEVSASGTVSPDETSYSVPLAGLSTCFNSDGRFDINIPGCPLDRGRQLSISGYSLSPVNPTRPSGNPARPTPTSWNTKPQGLFRYFSYKTGSVLTTDCRQPQGYSTPRPVQPDTLIDDPFPLTDSREQLCVVAGDSPSIDPSWQPFRLATQARVHIDTIPPITKPSANITLGETYIVLFEYLAEEIAFYEYKFGTPGSTDCSDPAGYRAFVQRLFLNRGGEPYIICAIPLDGAMNAGKPWEFILSNLGLLNPASRISTNLRLARDGTTAMTGHFPTFPVASLNTTAGVIPLDAARRDTGEIWLDTPANNVQDQVVLRLDFGSGTLAFPFALSAIAPGIFTVDGSGFGAAAGYAIRPDGSRQFLSTPLRLDPGRGMFLDVYATSIYHPALTANLGGSPIDIIAVSGEQLRLLIPPGFPLRGSLDLVLRAGPLASNSARIVLE